MEMSTNARVSVDFNNAQIRAKYNNPQFGKFVANEWHRLINPYTPRRTGALFQTVEIQPFKMEYKTPYAASCYYGVRRHFRRDLNPFATHHWDKAAEAAGQKKKLYTAINAYLRRN